MRHLLKKKLSIVVSLIMAMVIATTLVYAANAINKATSGSIEIVTSSGGGGGNTTAPDPDNITILNILNFVKVPTTSTENLTGQITIQNNTGSDLYYTSANISVNSALGEMFISANTTNTTIFAGDNQTFDIIYKPVGGGMPLGSHAYTIELAYTY